ncbi:MAG: hypothetical protein AAGF26_02465 [Cyanobacteria bacterium P01_G01_bin.49]
MSKIYFKLLNKIHASAGWTLVELMIASSLTLIVTMVAGFGLMTVARENQVANITGGMQHDINRAAEFITQEIRSASVIENSLEASDLMTFASDFETTGKTPVLALKVPGVPQRIVYYVQDAASNSIWRGPAVIRRWGPGFKSDGTYDSTQYTPNAWRGSPLVDMVVSKLPADQKDCRNTTTSRTEGIYKDTSGEKWHRLPKANADVKGFFVCVHKDKQLAQLHIYGTTLYTDSSGKAQGQLRSVASTNNANSRYSSKANYQVLTQAFARSEKVGSNGENFPDFYVDRINKQLTIEEDGKAQITVLSVDIPCEGGTLPPSDVTTQLNKESDGSTQPIGLAAIGVASNQASAVSSGDSLTLAVEATNNGGCVGMPAMMIMRSDEVSNENPHGLYSSNDSQYLQLDKIITDDNARNAVKSELQNKGLLKSDGNTLNLADNQVLYFMEFGFETTVAADSLISPTDAFYNDAIVLVELSN